MLGTSGGKFNVKSLWLSFSIRNLKRKHARSTLLVSTLYSKHSLVLAYLFDFYNRFSKIISVWSGEKCDGITNHNEHKT